MLSKVLLALLLYQLTNAFNFTTEKGGTRCHNLHSSADLRPGHLSRVRAFLSLCRCGRCTAGHWYVSGLLQTTIEWFPLVNDCPERKLAVKAQLAIL